MMRRVRLEPAHFWELRARTKDVEGAQLEVMKAQQRLSALLKELAKTYDIGDTCGWDDVSCELIQQERPS